MVSTDDFFIDPSELITPQAPNAHPYCMKLHSFGGPYPLFACNPFIIGGSIFVNSQSLSQNLAKLTISSSSQPTVKPLSHHRRKWKPISLRNQCGGMTRTGWFHKPEDLPNAEDRKRKGEDVLVEESQKKKIVSEEGTVEFIKSLKISEYSVVEQLRKLLGQFPSYPSCCH